MTQYLYFLFQREITEHSWFFFPPGPRKWYTRCHRAILWIFALWKPTLIRKVWSFNWKNMPWQESSRFEDYWVCQYQCESLLYKNMRWIKKSVFNLNCSSVLHVFKLSIDYEELWKETNQIPAFIIRCLQRVRKVRFTVVKAQIFLTLTYDDYIILISTL